MTAVHDAPPQSADEILAGARRAWRRAGVRRRDRRLLAAELAAELVAAESAGSGASVLGDAPADTATQWAHARGLTDRRLRLLAFVPAAVVAAVLAAGAVLAFLLDGFTRDGRTALGSPGPALILTLYVAAALLAAGGILGVTRLVLGALHDATAVSTVRWLAVLVPIGGVAATLAGVAVADACGFRPTPRTAALVCATALGVLLAAIVAARWTAVRRYAAGMAVQW